MSTLPTLDAVLADDATRCAAFPVCAERVFLAHAGVAPLCGAAGEALAAFAHAGAREMQEGDWVWREVARARERAAGLVGGRASCVSLLGPTSLGLNLVAHGLTWREGDEVVCYGDDYPANVYPWTALAAQGVRVRQLKPERPGWITPELVEGALSARTRLVALASCHFLSGYRIDIDAIGSLLHDRGVLFCLDGIQTAGAFPTPVTHVDFLSADAHKWMLGPCGAGIFYVASEVRAELRPALLGSWNVVSPGFVAQEDIAFEAGGRRYEPGTLNMPGIVSMAAALAQLDALGGEAVSPRLLALRAQLIEGVTPLGFRVYGSAADEVDPLPAGARSAIVSFVARRPVDLRPVVQALADEGIIVSLRRDRAGTDILRLSPHAYISDDDIARVVHVLRKTAASL